MLKADISSAPKRVASQCFPRARRLLSKPHFAAALKGSALYRDRHFVAYVDREVDFNARLGVVVSRKVSPRAVDRNRLKRHIRESFRRRAATAPVRVVVIAQTAARAQPGQTLQQSLAQLWDAIEKKCKRL